MINLVLLHKMIIFINNQILMRECLNQLMSFHWWKSSQTFLQDINRIFLRSQGNRGIWMKWTRLVVWKFQIKVIMIIKVNRVHQLIREMIWVIQSKKLRKTCRKSYFLEWVKVNNLKIMSQILIKVNFFWIKKCSLIKFQILF